jgi:hypothetical protein
LSFLEGGKEREEKEGHHYMNYIFHDRWYYNDVIQKIKYPT